MSERDDRLDNIRGHVKDAHDELHLLDEATLKQHKDELKRLDAVIAYAALVLEAADSDLMSLRVFHTIQEAALGISNGPLHALQNAEPYGDALLDAVAVLPVARGRDAEQEAKNAAAKFQQSASQRLNSLRDDISETKAQLSTLGDEIREHTETSKGEVDAEVTAFEAKLAELEQTITTQRVALSEQMTNQSGTFTTAKRSAPQSFKRRLMGSATS